MLSFLLNDASFMIKIAHAKPRMPLWCTAGHVNFIHDQRQGRGNPFLYLIRVVVLVTELKGCT